MVARRAGRASLLDRLPGPARTLPGLTGAFGIASATILLSGGSIFLLGEAYAFGVVWSFAMKALSVLVLRYKKPEAREWKDGRKYRKCPTRAQDFSQ